MWDGFSPFSAVHLKQGCVRQVRQLLIDQMFNNYGLKMRPAEIKKISSLTEAIINLAIIDLLFVLDRDAILEWIVTVMWWRMRQNLITRHLIWWKARPWLYWASQRIAWRSLVVWGCLVWADHWMPLLSEYLWAWRRSWSISLNRRKCVFRVSFVRQSWVIWSRKVLNYSTKDPTPGALPHEETPIPAQDHHNPPTQDTAGNNGIQWSAKANDLQTTHGVQAIRWEAQ